MLDLKSCLSKQDLKEAASVERRRRFEEDRKKRIFNARERIIGVDSLGLSNQINEKSELAQKEAEKHRKLLAEQSQQNAVALAKERELQMVSKCLKGKWWSEKFWNLGTTANFPRR